ncbi:MAG TPA: hypothetical protein VIO11_06195, partial [Candidatus Methanoperedens sp.]
MRQIIPKYIWGLAVITVALILLGAVYAQESGMENQDNSNETGNVNSDIETIQDSAGVSMIRSSYARVVITEPFKTIMARYKTSKPATMQRQMDLLNERYDLSDHKAKGVNMSRGKPIQEGVRVKLPEGVTWDNLAAMSPEEIRQKDLFPRGFMP